MIANNIIKKIVKTGGPIMVQSTVTVSNDPQRNITIMFVLKMVSMIFFSLFYHL